jgi:outer membrane protein assembly factor BamB
MSSDNSAIGFMIGEQLVSTTGVGESSPKRRGRGRWRRRSVVLFPERRRRRPPPLGAAWDIGADESGGGGGGPAHDLSFSSRAFVGGPLLPAATITIADNPVTPTIIAANDLRIRIPLGFPMRFDPAQTTLFISGPASFKVASQVKAYEDSDRTVVLDVLTDFGVNDWITVDFLRFWSYTAPAPADNLELEVGNDGVVCATDDKTITIVPDTFATLSSDDHQVFTQFQPPANALPFTVSEGTSSLIIPGTDIRIRIPAGFNMTWDTSGALSFSGPAAAKVSLPVIYEDSFRTLRIPVTTGFVPGDYVTVSGARFQGFTGISPSSNLVLDVGSTDTDDKTMEIVAASDVWFFTATAKNQSVKLEWLQPPSGLCDNVLILRRDDGTEPTGPFDGLALQVDFRPCTLGARDSVDDPFPLGNGTLYAYAAFVEYSGGTYTDGQFVKARPMDTVGTVVQWAYSTGATAMAPPGLRFSGGASYVYAVSNDSILHSMNGGSTGGDWPASWKPYELGGPAQARPPVVSFPVGSATSGAAFLGSQDGNVYAVNALDGSEEWKQSISSGVQAAPAGHFSAFFPGAFDIVITGTRDPNGPNELVALDVHSGTPVWSFDNSVGQSGDGKEIGIISGSASIDYQWRRAFFASHTRAGAMGSNRTLWCVDFSSGSPVLRWSLALGDIEGSPVLWNNAVYVGTVSNSHAVDRYAATGTVNWSHPIGNGQIKAFPFPQAGSNRVMVSTTSKVTSFEDFGLSYNIAWQLTLTDIPGPSTPVFVPGTAKVLVGSSDGNLYQFDAFTPLPTTRVQLGDGSSAVGVPTVDILKSMIYVGTDEGVIYGVTFPLQ